MRNKMQLFKYLISLQLKSIKSYLIYGKAISPLAAAIAEFLVLRTAIRNTTDESWSGQTLKLNFLISVARNVEPSESISEAVLYKQKVPLCNLTAYHLGIMSIKQ